jgi:hypothetical protein
LRGRRKRGEGGSRKKKRRESNTLNRIYSNSPGESIARERKNIVFVNRGKSPLFYKNNTVNRKAKRPVCMQSTGREA